MHAEHQVYIIYYASLYHRFSTTYAFLCWLEDKFNSTLQAFLMCSNIFSKTKAHCHMCIMTTSMHSLLMARTETILSRNMVRCFRFDYIIGIHICTERYYRTIITKLHSCHNSCFTIAHLLY